jgi:hypothetical protein
VVLAVTPQQPRVGLAEAQHIHLPLVRLAIRQALHHLKEIAEVMQLALLAMPLEVAAVQVQRVQQV